MAAAPQVAPVLGPLQRLPIELLEQIVESLDSIRDLVALDYAIENCSILTLLAFDWKNLAYMHKQNLLRNAALCKQITYNDNDKRVWDGMTMRASSWTRLPTTHTYKQMLRCNGYLPRHDLDGNQISFHHISDLFEKEQTMVRERLVFETRTSRNGGGYPSEESRDKIAMDEADARTYAKLLEQSTSMEQVKTIKRCLRADELVRQHNVGQQDAFRKFFYQLVTKDGFNPAVCMSCLAADTVLWKASCGSKKLRVRFCEGCLVEFAKTRAVMLVGWCLGSSSMNLLVDMITGKDDLAAVGIAMPKQDDEESKFLPGIRFTKSLKTFLYKFSADMLCQLYHGTMYDCLVSKNLSNDILTANGAKFDFVKRVVHEAIRLHRNDKIWSKIPVDVGTYAFWYEVTSWTRSNPPATSVFDWSEELQAVEHLAHNFWSTILLTKYQRHLPSAARKQFYVARIDQIEASIGFYRTPLYACTITTNEIARLCDRIHGKNVQQVLNDASDVNDGRLGYYFFGSAILLKNIEYFGIGFFQLLIELVAATSAGGIVPQDQMLDSFLDWYYAILRSYHRADFHDSFRSITEVPKVTVEPAVAAFMEMFVGPQLLPQVIDWAGDKVVTLRLPIPHQDVIRGANIPTFVALLAQAPGIVIIGEDCHAPQFAGRRGRIHCDLLTMSALMLQQD